jgi:uncharacterized cupin superfamily protein
VPEARVRETEDGFHVESEGWFVLNLDGARATRLDPFGKAVGFESKEHRFPHFGINVRVLEAGEPNSLYHGEDAQEAFLVLSGECILIVEEQERRLRAWDFVHLPPGTPHVVVGAGDGPCAVLMAGARFDPEVVEYPASEVAARYGAAVSESTNDSAKAYAEFKRPPRFERLSWPPPRGGD